MTKHTPDFQCDVNGFHADLDVNDFTEEDGTDEGLPSYVDETGYVVIDVLNDGSNPFFPEKYSWRFALISVTPGNADNLLAYQGIAFVPIVGSIATVTKVTIREEGPDIGMSVYLEGDSEDNPHVIIYLTDTASA